MGNLFLYVLTVGIWGTTWIAITFQLGNVPESWSVAYRFALAAIVLHLFCLARGFRLRFGLAPHLHFLGLGLFLFSANYWLVYLSTDHLASGLVAVVFSIMSVFNIFNAMLFLGKPLERRALLSAGLGLTGVTFIFWPEVQSLSLSDEGAVGLALALGSAMLASWGNTISARTSSEGLTVHAMNAWSMTYGATALAVLAVLGGAPIIFDTSLAYLGSLFYLAIFGSVVAFGAYFMLLHRIGLERAGYATVAMPVVALLISTLFEDYQWTPAAGFGLILVLAGNAMILGRGKQRPSRPTR